MVQAALLQLNAGPDITENLKAAEGLVREAAGRGAKFILTPENTCHMITPQAKKLETSLPEEGHPAVGLFSDLARELGVWISLGSIAVKVRDDKIANRGYIFNDKGVTVAQYDKIHLFDVDLPTGEKHRESNIVLAGDKVVVVDTPFGKVGMAICYDLRFADQFRALAKAGAEILIVPSAFTVPTGQAHWEPLLRARAIENGCFVLAAAQTGEHHGGRRTYGHSLAVGPWGAVLADGGEATGVVMVELDPTAVKTAREAIPSLQHDRVFGF
jgi:predicted amidohydrolase